MSKRMKTEAIADMLSEASYMGYRLTLGSVPPWMAAVGRRMRLGILLRISNEPTNMEWNEAEDGPKPLERVYYIEGLDGVEHRWTNASFVAIPQESWEQQIVVDEEAVRRFQGGRP